MTRRTLFASALAALAIRRKPVIASPALAITNVDYARKVVTMSSPPKIGGCYRCASGDCPDHSEIRQMLDRNSKQYMAWAQQNIDEAFHRG